MRRTKLLCCGLLPLAVPAPLHAQDEVEISANASVVSDYRFRGISLSDREPAVQGGVDLESGSFFIGTWASTIAEYGGANTEVDLYGGLRGNLGEVSWSASVNAYLYPGGTEVNYVELIAQAEQSFGAATIGLEAALAPRQANVTQANRYVGATAGLDLGSGWSTTLRGGYEDGFYDGKLDWEIGASYTRGAITASVSYVGTNHSAADEAGELGEGGLVGTLMAEF